MLDVPAANLLGYLDHANGWRRDNAQKQIIVLGDKSVVPELKLMAFRAKKMCRHWDGYMRCGHSKV